jgi:hypothetical protein
MKQLYFLDEEEKNRILNLHESATKRQYLSEQVTNQTNLPTITDNDRTYDYQKNGDRYFFKVKPNATDNRAQKYKDGNWHQGKGNAATAIKALFDKKPNGTQTQVKQNTNTDPSKAAQETAKVAQTGVAPAGTNTAAGTPAGTNTSTGTAGATSGVVTLKVTDAIVAPQASTTTSTKSATDTAETNMSSSNPVVASNAPDEDNSINQNATSR